MDDCLADWLAGHLAGLWLIQGLSDVCLGLGTKTPEAHVLAAEVEASISYW